MSSRKSAAKRDGDAFSRLGLPNFNDKVYTRNEPGDSRVEIDLVLPEKSVNDFHRNLKHVFADPNVDPSISAFGALDRDGNRIA